MSNPNIAEAGRATRFAPGLKSTRDASEKGNETKAAKKKTRELARLILSSPAPLCLRSASGRLPGIQRHWIISSRRQAIRKKTFGISAPDVDIHRRAACRAD